MNEAGRLWALSYNPSRVTLKHHQCDAYVTPYQMRATGNFRVWEERDPFNQRLVAIHVWGQTTEGHRVIWMDGRPHPPAWAPHSFRGFSTGEFVGHALRDDDDAHETGLVAPQRHAGERPGDDDRLLHSTRRSSSNVTVVTDPVFLSEPEVRSNDYSRQPVDHQGWLYACDDGEQILDRPADVVPNYLFGKQPFVKEFSDRYKLPMMASLAGADSIYPEFVQRLAKATPAEATALLSPAPGRPNETSKAAESGSAGRRGPHV